MIKFFKYRVDGADSKHLNLNYVVEAEVKNQSSLEITLTLRDNRRIRVEGEEAVELLQVLNS